MAETSSSALRLDSLLAKIRDDLRESTDFLCGRRQTIGPFTADPAGDNLPFISLEEHDVTTAALYLRELGLTPDALRLGAIAERVLRESSALSLGITAAGLSENEQDIWTELFGPLPDCRDPDRVTDRRMILVGRCSQFADYVDELIATIKATFKTEQGEANGGADSTPDDMTEKHELTETVIPLEPVAIPPVINADALMQRIICHVGGSQERKTGKDICRVLRVPYNGHTKEKLAALRRMNVFAAGHGYPLSEMGQKVYLALKDRKKSS
jgi:hypothetical protein